MLGYKTKAHTDRGRGSMLLLKGYGCGREGGEGIGGHAWKGMLRTRRQRGLQQPTLELELVLSQANVVPNLTSGTALEQAMSCMNGAGMPPCGSWQQHMC